MARQLHDSPLDENRQELRSALRLLTIQNLDAQLETLASQASQPGVMDEIRKLDERRRLLKSQPQG
jgi:hypothetical protein